MKHTLLALGLLVGISIAAVPSAPAKNAVPSFVVALTTDTGTPFCSATVINTQKQYALTADHCLGVPIQIYLNGHPITEVAHDPAQDFAIIQGVGISGPAVKVAWEDYRYENIVAWGFPNGFPVPVSIELKTYLPFLSFITGPDLWMVAQPNLQPGMSGGPILNESGELVAIGQMAYENGKFTASRPIFVVRESLGKFFEQ